MRLKRTFDFVLAGLLLVLLLPVLLSLALLVRVKLGTPVFFVQERPGKDGAPFNIVKFRTMRDDRDSRGFLLPDEVRLTRFGQFLRSTSLDELPELWNVLKGEMSFVGPRPDVPGFADALQGAERAMLSIRPGITGPATLKYRNEEELLAEQNDPEAYNREVIWPDKVKINLEYIRSWSLKNDLQYILQTVLK